MWTRTLAEFIADADTRSAPARVRELAVGPIIDTIGCMVAGLPSSAGGTVLAYAGLDTSASLADLWGTRRRVLDAEQRALVGGTLGAAIDFDDVSVNGHPSSILVSAILSVDDGPVLDGDTVLDAFLVGYEVGARLGNAFHLPHSRYGWHTTSTVGYFGAVAAVCRLYKLDADATIHALGIAASMSSGMSRNFGTATKPLHSGFAARGGLTAARLARLGATAAPDILDGERGFVAMYGLGQGDGGILKKLGAPWSMAESAPSLKKFPSCYTTHRLVDAVLSLQGDHDIDPDAVERVVVRAPTKSTASLIYDRPDNGLEAKFSAHYLTAAALLDRSVTIASFDDETVTRPEIQKLIDRIDLAEDPRCRPEDPEAKSSNPISGGFWEVTVHTRDGRRVQSRCSDAPGSPARQLTWTEIETKFVDCATSAGHTEGAARDIVAGLLTLTDVRDVRVLLDGLRMRSSSPDLVSA